MKFFPCAWAFFCLAATPGVAGDLPAAVASDPVAQTWNQAYQTLRKSPRSSEDYNKAVKIVSPTLKVTKASGKHEPGAANAQTAAPVPAPVAVEPIMDPDKVPRVVTFGKHGDSDTELREPQAARPDGAVDEIDFGSRAPASSSHDSLQK
jgi:hypothetical protein